VPMSDSWLAGKTLPELNFALGPLLHPLAMPILATARARQLSCSVLRHSIDVIDDYRRARLVLPIQLQAKLRLQRIENREATLV
jgi:hypothetical protein